MSPLVLALMLLAAEPAAPMASPREPPMHLSDIGARLERWTECRTPDDAIAARSGAEGVPELLFRVQHAATRCERVGAALALGSVVPEGRNALIGLLARTDDDELRLACVAGLPLSDPLAVVAAVRWHPLPSDVETVGLFVKPPWMRGDPIPLGPESKTKEDHAWDLVHFDSVISASALLHLLQSPDPHVRPRAAWALRTLVNEDYIEEPAADAEAALAKLVTDPDPVVRLAAIARPCPVDDRPVMGTDRGATILLALRDDDPLIRHVGLTLLTCGDEEGVPREILGLVQAMARSRTSPRESRIIASGLALATAPARADLIAFLEACSGDWTPMECMEGRYAVEGHAAIVTPWLRKLALAPGLVQAQAITTLGYPLHASLSIDESIALAASPDGNVRQAALRTLARAGPSAGRARGCLATSLADPDPKVRLAAVGATLHVLPDDVAMLERAASVASSDLAPRDPGLSLSAAASAETLEQLTSSCVDVLLAAAWEALVLRAPSADEALALARRALVEAKPAAAREAIRRLSSRGDVPRSDIEALERQVSSTTGER